MSRVDEALARARRNSDASAPVGPAPIPAGIAPGPVLDWSDEGTEAFAPDAGTADPVLPETMPAAVATPVTAPTVEPDPGGSLEHVALSEKLVTSPTANAGTVEQFRRLAAQLYLSQAERGTRTVMVASALAGEGKTLTAANLALTLSESYRRDVLLVDGDLRRPCAHHLFHVPNMSGLNDGIRAEVERKVPLIRITKHLTLLTAGRPDSDPMSVLSSERMRRVLDEAREKFEWVIIDTPPLGIMTDANLLASMIDAAVLVIRAGKTPAGAVQRVVDAIGRERIAGVVLNRVGAEQVVSEYTGYYDAVDQRA